MTLQDKLYKLRREKGWSQEELAELLDVSRQAVSKWERGESSPDTNNLLKLAALYDIPVDELARSFMGEESVKLDSTPKTSGISLKKPVCAEDNGISEDFIRMSMPEGNSNDGEIYPDRKPASDSFSASAAPDPSFTAEPPKKKKKSRLRTFIASMLSAPDPLRKANAAKFRKFPFWALAFLLFLFFGGMFGLWEFSWMFFLLIPIYYTSITAYERRNMNYFCYPLIATTAFLGFGFLSDAFFGFGNELWAIGALFWFMSIPLYYTGIAAYRHKKCKYFCFPVLVVMVWLVMGQIYYRFIEYFIWLLALIPFYYVYSSKIDSIIFRKRK